MIVFMTPLSELIITIIYTTSRNLKVDYPSMFHYRGSPHYF